MDDESVWLLLRSKDMPEDLATTPLRPPLPTPPPPPLLPYILAPRFRRRYTYKTRNVRITSLAITRRIPQ